MRLRNIGNWRQKPMYNHTQKLSEIVENTLNVESVMITEHSTLSDFPCDELDVYEFFMSVEEEFNIDMSYYFDMIQYNLHKLILIPIVDFIKK